MTGRSGASPVQYWMVDVVARELADFHWSNDPEDREVRAMAERAVAAIRNDQRQILTLICADCNQEYDQGEWGSLDARELADGSGVVLSCDCGRELAVAL